MVPQLHAKYLKKLWANPKENTVVTDKWTKRAILGLLACFRESKKFPQKFNFVSFENLWSLNFIQNIKKLHAKYKKN